MTHPGSMLGSSERQPEGVQLSTGLSLEGTSEPKAIAGVSKGLQVQGSRFARRPRRTECRTDIGASCFSTPCLEIVILLPVTDAHTSDSGKSCH